MARYPDMRELARHATENFSRLESLENFRPPYPAQGTPNWWALRLQYETVLLGKLRKERAKSPMECRLNNLECDAAKWAAIGNEDADRDYQELAPVQRIPRQKA